MRLCTAGSLSGWLQLCKCCFTALDTVVGVLILVGWIGEGARQNQRRLWCAPVVLVSPMRVCTMGDFSVVCRPRKSVQVGIWSASHTSMEPST